MSDESISSPDPKKQSKSEDSESFKKNIEEIIKKRIEKIGELQWLFVTLGIVLGIIICGSIYYTSLCIFANCNQSTASVSSKNFNQKEAQIYIKGTNSRPFVKTTVTEKNNQRNECFWLAIILLIFIFLLIVSAMIHISSNHQRWLQFYLDIREIESQKKKGDEE